MVDQLPHNDPDLERARKLNKARQEGKEIDTSDDDFLNRLLAFKKEQRNQLSEKTTNKEAVWDNIAAATKASGKATVTPLRSENLIKWAAAAIILIGGLFSFIYLQWSAAPEVIAQSEATIQTVTLDDGSKVTLRPYSTLSSLSEQQDERIYKLRGEALFEVTHNPERTFSVATNSGTVSVLGTTFTLSSWGKSTQVFLEKGSVKVTPAQHDSSVIIAPGESVVITEEAMIPVVKKAMPDEFTDWLNQELIFEDKPAYFVALELEQQFNISIELPQKVTNDTLSGRLSVDNLNTALRDLEIVLNGKFKQTKPNSYRFEPNTP